MLKYGHVCVCNIYCEEVKVTINQQSPQVTVPAPQKKDNYLLTPVLVARSRLNLAQLNEPKFVNGENHIMIHHESGNVELTIDIPHPPDNPMHHDVLLYLSYCNAAVYRQDGALLAWVVEKPGPILKK